MKQFIKPMILCAGVALMTACSDSVLDTKPLDKFSAETVWSDPSLTQSFLYDTYRDISRKYIQMPGQQLKAGNAKFIGAGVDDISDNVAVSKNFAVSIYKDLIDRNYDAGWDNFALIRQCNMIIENVSASDAFDETMQKSFIGQARMLRAMIYFNQAKLFGKYPIIDRVLTPEDDLKLGRSESIKEVYDFILADLDYAAQNLSQDAPSGIFTSGAALALQAEVALHGASYIESGADAYYEKCATASEALFAQGKYSLDENFKGMFNDYACGMSSSEVIFGYYMSAENTLFNMTGMQVLWPNMETYYVKDEATPQLTANFQGWPYHFPTPGLMLSYLVVDTDGVAKPYNETSYYADMLAGNAYVSDVLFKHADKRLDASIVRDSTYLGVNLVTLREGGNMHRKMTKKSTNLATRTGLFTRKTVYEKDMLWAKNATDYHIVILRLGRSYLNYAEAKLRQGDVPTAVHYINETRRVHGGLPALSTSISLDEAWKWYKNERRCDLYMEGDRYFSLLRWGKKDGLDVIPELNHETKFIEIAADGKSFELINMPFNHSNNIGSFSARRYLFPVPQKQRDLNENLDQNPGW